MIRLAIGPETALARHLRSVLIAPIQSKGRGGAVSSSSSSREAVAEDRISRKAVYGTGQRAWPQRKTAQEIGAARPMGMTTTIIRPARPEDLPRVLDLYRHLNPDDPQPDADKAECAWSALMGSDLTMVIVADAGGELVSTCTLVIIPNLTRRARPYGLIENVVTHPGHRRTGLGQAVLSAALKAAWNADCYKVMLATGSRREETLRFYEKAGFKRGGKTFFEARRP